MLTFPSQYDFYRLKEDVRKSLIGECFKVGQSFDIYFPIQLAVGEFNYGVRQGLILITPIMKSHKGGKWFRVAAISPDDLDKDLDFGASYTHLRQEIIDYIRRMNKINVTYDGVLGEIQEHFQVGERTS